MQEIEEKYAGEFEDINSVINSLESVFPDVNFSLDFEYGNIQKFMIVVDNFEFYMKNVKFKNWNKLLSKKFKKLRFFCCYRKS